MNTYALLLSKLTKDTDPKEFDITETRMQSLERQLNSAFEEVRLMTSELHVL